MREAKRPSLCALIRELVAEGRHSEAESYWRLAISLLLAGRSRHYDPNHDLGLGRLDRSPCKRTLPEDRAVCHLRRRAIPDVQELKQGLDIPQRLEEVLTYNVRHDDAGP